MTRARVWLGGREDGGVDVSSAVARRFRLGGGMVENLLPSRHEVSWRNDKCRKAV